MIWMTEDDVIARLVRGDVIRMEIADGERHWWFELPDAVIPANVMKAVRRRIKIREYRDSLFRLPGDSQTWRAVRSRRAAPTEEPRGFPETP